MAAELSTGALVYTYAREKGVKFILVEWRQHFKKVKVKVPIFVTTGQMSAKYRTDDKPK